MTTQDQIIGELKEARRWQENELRDIKKDLASLHKKIDAVIIARALERGKIIGISSAVSVIVSATAFTIVHFWK